MPFKLQPAELYSMMKPCPAAFCMLSTYLLYCKIKKAAITFCSLLQILTFYFLFNAMTILRIPKMVELTNVANATIQVNACHVTMSSRFLRNKLMDFRHCGVFFYRFAVIHEQCWSLHNHILFY